MKILHVLDHSIPLHSGYAFRTLAILREQRRLGWETFHITGSKQGACKALKETVDGYSFYRTAPVGEAVAKWPVINQVAVVEKLVRRLRRVAREVRPDVLHAHSPVLDGIAALRVGRLLNIPVVYEVRAFWEDAAADHGTTTEGSIRYRLTRQLETSVLRRVQAVTTICEGLRSEIVSRGIDADKVTVIPNAVDAERFAAAGVPDRGLKRRHGLEGKTVLGFVGSFYAYEGLGLLIEALPALLAEDPDIRVLLVGGGPQDAKLRRKVEEGGLEGKVLFAGRVPHEQVQRYYDIMDIMVYPRLSMRLTELVTPLKPLEAMAQAKLVIASDVGGHRELMRAGETGYLFAAGDAQSLKEAVAEALSNRSNWRHIQSQGRAFVESERAWCASVARYSQVYSAVLSR